MTLLTVLGLVLLKASLNILHPRQWVLQQTLSDAYLTFERASAERIPFAQLINPATSPWPLAPVAPRVTANVQIGILPGGTAVTGTVTRALFADALNYPSHGGTGTELTNPAGVQTYRAQSVLTYTIGGRVYVKSRTVLRSQ